MIFLGMADIKACFRFARIQADLTRAFGFIADDLYNLATAIVFGSTTSAFILEASWQAIKSSMNVFANRLDLVIKYKEYLDMLKWEEADPHAEITPAFSCAIGQGVINKKGNSLDLPARIYVDNALMLAVPHKMKKCYMSNKL
jgi:hypothetical protein